MEIKRTKQNNNPPTVIDLFSGAGGLSWGFKTAGFKFLLSIDHNATAIDTYQSNLCHGALCGEITESTKLPRADVIIGGPPCQGFSSAGLRRANDHRNTLVGVFAELIAEHRPRAFVFENVEGFLSVDGGERMLDLLGPLIAAGYRIHLRKINAANYGVPQHRKRVIAIGGLGWNPTFPAPTHMAFGAPGASRSLRHLPPASTLHDALDGLRLPTMEPPGIPQGHFVKPITEGDLQRIKRLKSGQTMRDLPPELWHQSYIRRAYRRVMDGTPTERRGGAPAGLRRLRRDEPCKAVTSGAISEFVHPSEDRFLTLRECARVQTFSDRFIFTGNVSEQILQIGNAVPPLLAEQIARTLYKDLISEHESNLKGDLLTFIPTLSDGHSPALDQAITLVEKTFSIYPTKIEQLALWD